MQHLLKENIGEVIHQEMECSFNFHQWTNQTSGHILVAQFRTSAEGLGFDSQVYLTNITILFVWILHTGVLNIATH